jgi:hypothetical protein
MFKVKGWTDYYNERGKYNQVELYFHDSDKAKDAADKFERAIVINLNSQPSLSGSYPIDYSKGTYGR